MYVSPVASDDRCLGPLRDLVSLPPGKIMICHGSRGSGKTSVALQALPELHVCSSEMDPDLLGLYARRFGVTFARISMIHVDHTFSPPVVRLGIAPEARAVLLDSITATGAPMETWEALQAWVRATGGRAIAILHHTKDEQPAGMARILHGCDVEVLVERTDAGRRLETLKNRFGACGTRLFVLGAEAAPDRYYSVEGTAGRYQLVPWPSGGKHAAYLQWAERQVEAAAEDNQVERPELPPVPSAVAAQRTLLAPGGWLEPFDWRERKAFAEAAGVPYWSPTGEEQR